MDQYKNADLLGLATIELDRHQFKQHTKAAYIQWINRFIMFSGSRLLTDDGVVFQFMAKLKDADKSIATQKSGLSAIRFFYKHILKRPCIYDAASLIDKKPRHIELITYQEIEKLMADQDDDLRLVVLLIYGAGLRMPEVINLRVGAIHFRKRSISAKSEFTNRRHVLFPNALIDRLKAKIDQATAAFYADLDAGILPAANHRTATDQKRAWLFPGRLVKPAEGPGQPCRRHASACTFQKALKKAGQEALNRKITAGTLRNSFAYSLFIQGCSKKMIMAAMGYGSPNTATCLLNALRQIKQDCAPASPLDLYERAG